LLTSERLSKKPLLFKSFTGLTVCEFDYISTIKRSQKNMLNMRYNAYPKEKIEKETGVPEDHSNLT
jgi:hypothetical protein